MQEEKSQIYTRYHLYFAIYVILSGFRNVLVKHAISSIAPLLYTALVSLFVVISLSLFDVIGRKPVFPTGVIYLLRRTDIRLPIGLLALGTILGTGGMSVALANGLSALQYSIIDVTAYPLMVGLLARSFVKEDYLNAPDLLWTLALAIVGVGLFNVSSFSSDILRVTFLGFLAAFASEFGWAISIISVTQLVRKNIGIDTLIRFRFLATFLVLSPSLLLLTQSVLSPLDYFLLVVIATAGFLIPLLLAFRGLKKLSVVTFSVYTMFTPITTFILASYLATQESLGLIQVVGICFIALGILRRLASEKRLRSRKRAMT